MSEHVGSTLQTDEDLHPLCHHLRGREAQGAGADVAYMQLRRWMSSALSTVAPTSNQPLAQGSGVGRALLTQAPNGPLGAFILQDQLQCLRYRKQERADSETKGTSDHRPKPVAQEHPFGR